jgi:hypothetical protein
VTPGLGTGFTSTGPATRGRAKKDRDNKSVYDVGENVGPVKEQNSLTGIGHYGLYF